MVTNTDAPNPRQVNYTPMNIPPEEMETCLKVLQQIANSHGTILRDQRFNSLISKVYREGKRHDVQHVQRRQIIEDRAVMATTAMVQIQRDALPAAALPMPSAAARPETQQTRSLLYLQRSIHRSPLFLSPALPASAPNTIIECALSVPI